MRVLPGRLLVTGIVLAAALLSWPGGAGATEPPVARVHWLSGEVAWRPASGDDWAPLAPSHPLAAGDEIRTGATGRVEIIYQGEAARLWIEPDTRVVLGETYRAAVLASTGGSVRLAGDLPPFRAALVRVGSVWAEVRSALSRLWRFEVETPTAVAGVRGTRFRITVTPQGETRLYVAQGLVELRSLSRQMLVEAGRVAWVPAGEHPPAGRPAPPDQAGDPANAPLWPGDPDQARAFRTESEQSEPEFRSDLEALRRESEEERYRWLHTLQPLVRERLTQDAQVLGRLIDEARDAEDGQRSGLLAWLLSLAPSGTGAGETADDQQPVRGDARAHTPRHGDPGDEDENAPKGDGGSGGQSPDGDPPKAGGGAPGNRPEASEDGVIGQGHGG